jgi:hypothetical protein
MANDANHTFLVLVICIDSSCFQSIVFIISFYFLSCFSKKWDALLLTHLISNKLDPTLVCLLLGYTWFS